MRLNELVESALLEEQARVHSFCWMTNHLHLAIQVSGRPLGRVVHCFATRYARYFNGKYSRSGHLFENRYYANLVDLDEYLLELVRYIHRNPVKAGLVGKPGSYLWSSHRFYMGRDQLDWLSTRLVLALFHSEIARARVELDRFVLQGVADDHADELFCGAVDDHQKLQETNPDFDLDLAGKCLPQISLEEIVKSVCDRNGIDDAQLSGPSRQRDISRIRAEIAYEAIHSGAANLATIGRRLNRSGGAIAALIRRYAPSRRDS
jgi:REP element-mobilizing transposase RayT